MKDKNVIKRQVCQTVDYSTGELIEEQKYTTYKVEREPEFIKLYLEDVARLNNLSRSCSNIMYELLKFMTYENIVIINPFVKKVIAERINSSVNVIEHQITDLIREGIMCRMDKGTYLMNPDLFGKGKWEEVHNIRLTINYDPSGKTFKTTRNLPEQLELKLDNNVTPISGLPIHRAVSRSFPIQPSI